MCLNQTQQQSGHLYLSGMWLGVDLRTSTKKMCLKEIGLRAQKNANHSRFNSQHDYGDLHDHLNEHEKLHFMMNKIFMSSKYYEANGYRL